MRKVLFSFIALLTIITGTVSAHVIGVDSRTQAGVFPVSPKYYKTTNQARLAVENLAHFECKKNGRWNQNSTSAFFIDINDYTKRNNIDGNFNSCQNKVLLSVAHYVNPRGGEENSICTIYQSFTTTKGKSTYAGVERLSIGTNVEVYRVGANPDAWTKDFTLIEIESLKNDDNPSRENLKICSLSDYSNSTSHIKSFIMPQLSKHLNDVAALKKNLKIKAKITSDRCHVKTTNESLFEHSCDIDKRSSGSPLLYLDNGSSMCVVGIQSAEAQDKNGNPVNLAVKLQNNLSFENSIKKFMEGLSCKQ